MQAVLRWAPALALAALAAPSFASSSIYTTQSSFMAQVNAGAYTETFTGLNQASPPSTYTSGGFSYTISAPSGLFTLGTDLGTNQVNEALTISFTSGNVTAVGGNFYAVDINPTFQSSAITLTLGDGTTTTFTPTSMTDSFRGFTSTSPITSLVISNPGAFLYATLDNITVGVATPVPEPAAWMLACLGGAALLLRRRFG